MKKSKNIRITWDNMPERSLPVQGEAENVKDPVALAITFGFMLIVVIILIPLAISYVF